MADELDKLKKRIKELENEVQIKDKDLKRFRDELVNTNAALEKLISQVAQELKIASLIQKTLTPTEYPNISGIEFSTKFIPGTESGGDYLDIFEHEDKFRFGILASSASGYSMSALFLSVLLKFTGQMEARRGTEPHKIIEMIVAELLPHISEKDRASVFYAVVDRRSFEVSYCSIGRITALMYNHGQNKLLSLENHLTPLSKDFNVRLESQKVSLNPRDRLLLVTDGVTQALNPQGEKFGTERLYKAVLQAPKSGVHELRNEILYRVEKFTDKVEPLRDMTVIVTEV